MKTPFWSMSGPVLNGWLDAETTVGVSRFLPICITTSRFPFLSDLHASGMGTGPFHVGRAPPERKMLLTAR